MSLEKECTHHKEKKKRIIWRLCAGLIIFNFILLLLILLIWAVLQPKKPRFILQDATVFNFNVSAPNILTSSIQVTIYSRNPNDKIGIYYDKLDVYATYNNQQITYYTAIPSVYQGHKDVNVWSPFILGNNVPIAPYNGVQLTSDQSNGALQLTIKIDGRVKWKVGTFTSGRYHLHAACWANIPLGNRGTGISVGTGIKYQLSQSCRVSL
ncbi:hypothetical protein ACH5RR_004501 [Cinchona calisaya]|uniref:Late embryogenesis abundant protein LEA-2 subgroup domain-containing protein n=1 Tax=Cinchona calisaya TaxID=153742 RepID=A0ABD3AXT5_9GENT